MTRYELAGLICRTMANTRRQRIGEPLRFDRGDPLSELPEDEKQNWLDVADVLLVVVQEQDNSSRLRSLADDWDRYGYILVRDPEHRDSMRRAVVVEMREAVEKMWAECR